MNKTAVSSAGQHLNPVSAKVNIIFRTAKKRPSKTCKNLLKTPSIFLKKSETLSPPHSPRFSPKTNNKLTITVNYEL